jgi:hypothetical protein
MKPDDEIDQRGATICQVNVTTRVMNDAAVSEAPFI